MLFRNNFATYTTVLSGSTPLGMAEDALDCYRQRLDKRGIVATDYKVQSEAPVTHLQFAEAISRIDAAERLLAADREELDRRAAVGEPCGGLFQAKIKLDVAASVRGCAEAATSCTAEAGRRRSTRRIPCSDTPGTPARRPCAPSSTTKPARRVTAALCGKPLFGSLLAFEKKAAA